MSKRFVVAGTGRSGTRYIQSVLRKCGMRVSHEQIFCPGGVREWGNRHGESSGLAPPFLKDHYPGILILHQVRHPLAVIRSMLSRRTSTRAKQYEKQFLVPTGFPDLDFKNDRMRRATLMWLHRNELVDAAKPAMRWRVEDLDLPTLRGILDLIGWDAGDDVLEEALAKTSTSLNRSNRKHPMPEWSDLPADLRPRTVNLAREYGYPI